jgi:phospholipid/cholesterol/gamma-HCH transport system substrate-binding protein
MENEISKQFRLGLLVIIGALLLGLSIFLIGRNHDLFGPTISIVAFFKNSDGLQPGNSVRFSGAEAGTVESVEVISDTAVRVGIKLQEKYRPFIKTDAVASISTDGLMGNKLVNIANISGSTAETVVEGSTIRSLKPIETDEMLRTLNKTNDYVTDIAINLKNITDKMGNSQGIVWKLLGDTVLSGRIDTSFMHFQLAAKNISALSRELNQVVGNLNSERGLFGALTKDTAMGRRLNQIISSMNTSGEQAASITAELLTLTKDIEQGKGTIGMLLRDSTVSNDLKTSVDNLKHGSESLRQSMEAMKKIPLLKRYIGTPEKQTKFRHKSH